MLIEEKINDTLIKRYSDAGFQILQKETGFLYPEAIDVIPCRYTYEETNIPIEELEEEEEESGERIGEEDNRA